ncbi:MAG: TrbC/VIRB2 family protein [Parcubacteria group bacterium ADurb.Bin316]|nr:MAG: TrbC/VIRB2 family protein [Parcubacteria group bacterium ADurb.Bin316]HOZ55641.1 TrbC/VirB2 family protein [bacterium]
MKKTFKNALAAVALLAMIMPALLVALPALATDPLGINDADFGLPSSVNDPKEAAVNIVTYLMTFLGIIAVIVILYGGFLWLTAGGNEDRVGSAKKTIIAGIIGLVIIIAAYAIVQIVVGFAYNIVGNPTP